MASDAPGRSATRTQQRARLLRWAFPVALTAMAPTGSGAQSVSPPPDAKGTARAEERAIPIKTETISFEHWTLVCEERLGAVRTKACVGRLPVFKENRQLIVVLSLAPDKAGGIQIEVRTPTSLLLAPGVRVAFSEAAQRLMFSSCDPASCLAGAAADENTLKGLREEGDARVTFITAKPENYVVKFSTVGARRILEALGPKASAQP